MASDLHVLLLASDLDGGLATEALPGVGNHIVQVFCVTARNMMR
jgi:hypothetical protein